VNKGKLKILFYSNALTKASVISGIQMPNPIYFWLLKNWRIVLKLRVKSITIVIPIIDSRKYDQLDALSSSSNIEISRLSVIIKNLKKRIESMKSNQTDMMDRLNNLDRSQTG
jgi:hypothetical protein